MTGDLGKDDLLRAAPVLRRRGVGRAGRLRKGAKRKEEGDAGVAFHRGTLAAPGDFRKGARCRAALRR